MAFRPAGLGGGGVSQTPLSDSLGPRRGGVHSRVFYNIAGQVARKKNGELGGDSSIFKEKEQFRICRQDGGITAYSSASADFERRKMKRKSLNRGGK